MSLTFAILTGVAMGVAFGFALEKSRVFEPGVIVGQMQLRNFIMLKVFLTAVATGAVVMFPAWITHSVKPSKARGLRVSIAFNINFADFTGTVARPRWKGMPLKRPPDC